MMIVDQLVVQHQTLRNKASDGPNAVEMNEVMALMDQVQAASAHVENGKQREQLQAILYHWNGYVHENTGVYPGTQLAAYSPVPSAENTGRVTTTRPDIALPDVHWGVWTIAILLFVGGAIIVIWPRLFGGNNTEAETLAEATQIAETVLLATQTTLLYEATATAMLEFQATAAAEALQASPVMSDLSPTDQPSGPVSYTVQSGDTLFGIARRYGVSVNDIMTINGLASQSLAVGQTLVLPNPPLTPEAPVSVEAVTGVVNPPANPNEQIVEIVIRVNTAVLHSGPGAEFSEINVMARGTFVYAVGRNQPGSWYLVQLEDGLTRGWVAAEEVGLIYPAVPEAIPVITTP